MIHCRAVTKTFSDGVTTTRWAVDELHIAAGRRVLVTGPSGCGKSTLLNLIAGLLRPDSGEITVDGTRIDQLCTAEVDFFRGECLGLIFQSFHLLTSLSVLDNVLLGAHYGRKWTPREARPRATALLEAVGLTHRSRLTPGRLSIGEQQRVAIARALINEPKVLLADEPTASLDRANAATVLDLLFRLCAEHGTTLVMVSHDLSPAERFDATISAAGWMAAQEVAHV